MAEALARVDSDKNISCVSTLFARVGGLSHEPQKTLIYQPWILGAVELLLRNARHGISGSWEERLTREISPAVTPTIPEEFRKQFEDIYQKYLIEDSIDGGGVGRKQWIGVHWRRGDFRNYCLSKPLIPPCFPSISSSLSQILQLKSETCLDDETCPILVASDSRDRTEIARLKAAGLLFVDHEELGTLEALGLFADSAIDLALLDSPKLSGFIGNHYSTLSNWVRSRRGWRGTPAESTLEFM